jgi:hypothetical protein
LGTSQWVQEMEMGVRPPGQGKRIKARHIPLPVNKKLHISVLVSLSSSHYPRLTILVSLSSSHYPRLTILAPLSSSHCPLLIFPTQYKNMSSPTPQNEAPSQPSAYYPEHLKEMWSEITTMNNHLFTIRQGQVEQKNSHSRHNCCPRIST